MALRGFVTPYIASLAVLPIVPGCSVRMEDVKSASYAPAVGGQSVPVSSFAFQLDQRIAGSQAALREVFAMVSESPFDVVVPLPPRNRRVHRGTVTSRQASLRVAESEADFDFVALDV
ncbi:MAG: hypothetical protein IPJ14_07805 [Kineosporiaceae bacterium]|nr:hypothetical protein [Kineosporiaceae bacterium]MBK7622556.1 hypothetical protein [Kineosporiaceae bacterium]